MWAKTMPHHITDVYELKIWIIKVLGFLMGNGIIDRAILVRIKP